MLAAKSDTTTSIIRAALILLWTYAAMSKLLDYNQSRTRMLEQVFPVSVSEILVWVVPVAELITAALLLFKKTRLSGLNASLFLLLQFTSYIILVMSGLFGRISCYCGGILEKMTWGQHLYFNLVFLTLTLFGLVIHQKERRHMAKSI
ncbi:MAG: MauE/DoxX family redox-associated membrane protein [Daejeonella sp.]